MHLAHPERHHRFRIGAPLATWREDAEQFAAALGLGRVRVVLQSELPTALRVDGPSGYYHPALYAVLRPVVLRLGDRPVPVVVIDDAAIADPGLPDFAAEFHAKARRLNFVRTLVHELAHVGEATTPVRGVADPERFRAELAAYLPVVSRKAPVDRGWPAWHLHDCGFIRAAIHVWHRAARLGEDIVLAGLCAGERYGLSSAYDYLAALGDEPERLVDEPVEAIRMTQPPVTFSQLWLADTVGHKSQPQGISQ